MSPLSERMRCAAAASRWAVDRPPSERLGFRTAIPDGRVSACPSVSRNDPDCLSVRSLCKARRAARPAASTIRLPARDLPKAEVMRRATSSIWIGPSTPTILVTRSASCTIGASCGSTLDRTDELRADICRSRQAEVADIDRFVCHFLFHGRWSETPLICAANPDTALCRLARLFQRTGQPSNLLLAVMEPVGAPDAMEAPTRGSRGCPAATDPAHAPRAPRDTLPRRTPPPPDTGLGGRDGARLDRS